ncbi:MAG: ATP-dependent DNA helicase RecG [Rickettsiales bacterium]|nr:ATP-dependent DNA helicase RecG [Rickettsiales bacterium]
MNKNEPRVIDILLYKPYKILTRIEDPDLKLLKDGDLITAKVSVDTIENGEYKKPYKIRCYNKTGYITIIYFNYYVDYITKNYPIGATITISGAVKKNKFNGELIMTHPDVNKALPPIEQVYQLTYGLTNKIVRDVIHAILEKIKPLQKSIVINDKRPFFELLLSMHYIQNINELDTITDDLAFYELFAEQIALKQIRKEKQIKKEQFTRDDTLKNFYLGQIPFTLTNAQKKAINEIESDTYSDKIMLRLLQGDVGSGKTIVAFLTMLPYIQNKKQVALMCPTSILATQHYNLLKSYGINSELLIGTTKKRKQLLKKIENGEIDVLIGTHTLFQKDVVYKDLKYVIIDEQHKFGVVQRLNLIEKNYNLDTLIMSATPIPRTLSLSIYGDIELSIIDEKPKNRMEIITSAIHKNNLDKMIERIKERLRNKEKVYWVCPFIDESESEEFKHVMPVTKRYEYLKDIFKDEVGLLHGDLKEQKEQILNEFVNGNLNILISTSVIEVGIDVPNATIIIIENPERFGLSQIHQLRGRVGRGDKQSYCILLYERRSENFKKRADILVATNDGFKIAEEDLKLRGGGDILGIKQSGLNEMLFFNLQRHYNTLVEVNKAVREHKVDDKTELLLKVFGYDNFKKQKMN